MWHALTHAVEAYIGNSTTPGTRKDAIKAIRLIFANIEKAYQDGSNLRARKNMLYASYLAGAAIFIWKIKELKKNMGIGDTFSCIKQEDIPKLSHYADKEANPLYPVPVLMNAAELEQFYYTLMES